MFLGLYIDNVSYINSLNCSSCAYLGAVTPCGYQLCCNFNAGYEYSYAYCAGVYGTGLYFILFIAFICYAVYELLLMICMLCNGSALRNNQEIIVIDQNQQLINMNGYQQGYQQGYQVQAYQYSPNRY